MEDSDSQLGKFSVFLKLLSPQVLVLVPAQLAKPPYCTGYTSGGPLDCSYDWDNTIDPTVTGAMLFGVDQNFTNVKCGSVIESSMKEEEINTSPSNKDDSVFQ